MNRMIAWTIFAASLAGVGCSTSQARSNLHAVLAATDDLVTAAEADPTLVPRLADAATGLDQSSATLQDLSARLKAAATSRNLAGLHEGIQLGLMVAAPQPTPSPSPGP